MSGIWEVTNLDNAKVLAAKIRRWMEHEGSRYFHVEQHGTTLLIGMRESRPWSCLNGYMTNSTQITPAKFEDCKNLNPHALPSDVWDDWFENHGGRQGLADEMSQQLFG